MSFMYKAMMSRGPNKRKIKINEENILRLITNSEEEDEEDEDYSVKTATVNNEDDADNSDDSSDSATTDTDSSENESQDSDSNEQNDEDDESAKKSLVGSIFNQSSNRRKQMKRRQKNTLHCPTVKELETEIASEYYGMPTATAEILTQAKKLYKQTENMVNNLHSFPSHVCVVCLNNDERDEKHRKVLTCQKCGTSAHIDCYNMQPNIKKVSSDDIWVCDSCVYGGNDIVCQFCPNVWGCMKETKCGRWCHIVCARNILADFMYNKPNTSRKSPSTIYIKLNDCNNKMFGSKECILCEERLVAKTGICINCDAGLCKSTFHVTCAQKHGLLAKVPSAGDGNNNTNSSGEIYYANCPLHCDKEVMKRRQKNFILQLKTSQIQEQKYENASFAQQNVVSAKIAELRQAKKRKDDFFTPPRPPLEQVPRLLSSDAHFTRLLNTKAEKMFGISTKCPATIIPKATEVRKRHYVAPSLTTDFSAYFADRQLRIEEEKTELASAIRRNQELAKKQKRERLRYNDLRSNFITQKADRSEMKSSVETLRELLSSVYEIASAMAPSKIGARKRKSITPRKITNSKDNNSQVHNDGSSSGKDTSFSLSPPMSPTCKTIPDAESFIDLKSCGICKGQENQHLLARCDVCKEWQHLACLDPPLTQMPKRTKFSLWQCSECADTSGSSSSDCDTENHGSFVSQDGRRLTRRLRKVPEKLAVGFPDDAGTLKTKRSIGYSKKIFKDRLRLRKSLKDVSLKKLDDESPIANKETVESPCQKFLSKSLSDKSQTSEAFQTISKSLSERARTSEAFQTLSKSLSEKSQTSEAFQTLSKSPSKKINLSETFQKLTSNNKISPVSHSGPSHSNYLRHEASVPIFKLPTRKSINKIIRTQPKKVIFIKRAKLLPHRTRPLGLGKIRKVRIPIKKIKILESSKPVLKKPNLLVRACHVCGNTDDDVHIVTCNTCKDHYHWKCCDPPLKINPVTKYAAWECSECVDKKDEEKEKTVIRRKSPDESLENPDVRRISRKRKPPEVFEPDFNLRDQQKIFKSIKKKKVGKEIVLSSQSVKLVTLPSTSTKTVITQTARHKMESTLTAARCLPITSVALKGYAQWSPKSPIKILKPFHKVDLTNLKSISIVKNASSNKNVISLVPRKLSNAVILPLNSANSLTGDSSVSAMSKQ